MRLAQVFAAVILMMVPLCAEAQVDPIETYLSSAEQKATTVVNNAGTQGRAVAMEAGQAALNAIASFRAAYADSLDKTADTLRGEQAVLFRTITMSVDRLDAYTKGATGDLQGIAETLGTAVANIPLSKDIPRVRSVGPIFMVEGTMAPELVVKGIGLSNGDPVLEIFGGLQRPHTESDTELRFQLPVRAVTGRNPLLVPTTLRLYERKSRFLLFSKYVPHTYPVRYAVYPGEVGTYSLIPRRRVTRIETAKRITPEYRCDSPRGEGSHSVAANIVATPGWAIDVSTISYDRTYSNDGGFTMNTTSSAGFTATLSCTGSGRVVVGGIVIDQGSIGVEKGGFSYTETRTVPALEDAAPLTGSVRWGDSLALTKLPPDTETVIMTLSPFTGQNLSLEGAGSNRFVTLTFNSASKIATIAARDIEQALRTSN